MKNRIILLTVLTLLLTACGNSQAGSMQTDDELPVATQLVLGTLQLEDTEQAVTSEQAKELLPMWQVYKSLISSGTAAQEEIDGLVEQIQETLTVEQMTAITAMNLAQQDVFAAIQAQNITASSGGGGGQSSSAGISFGPPDGGMPSGGPPEAGIGADAPSDGGMGDMGGAGPSPSTEQSQNVGTSAGAGRSAGVPTTLVEALIQLLEQRAGNE